MLEVKNIQVSYPSQKNIFIVISEKLRKNSVNRKAAFVALDNITFSLEKGDVLGIVGHNGSGKSTLAKVISGVIAPSGGHVTAKAKPVALLEISAGFDPDLTVVENVYLRSALLGYSKTYTQENCNAIIEYAGLEEFADRPFRHLSSGMKARLGFAISSLVRPEILILDEVLSVGDREFRIKSKEKMKEIVSNGATVIFVSHSLPQIRELCNKVLWLDHGKQVAFGDTQSICDQYEAFMNSKDKKKK